MTRKPASRQKRLLARLAVLESSLPMARPQPTIPIANSSSRNRKKRRGVRTAVGESAGRAGASRRVSGSDIVASVSVASATPAGAGILHASLNPRNFPGTRLYQESQLWTRWRPLSLRFRLVSSASPLVVGRMALGWHSDPRENFPTGEAGIIRMGTLRPHLTSHPSQPIEISVPSGIENTSQRWYVMDGEASDADHGTLIALVMSALSASTGSLTFQVELNWTVEFEGPDIQLGSKAQTTIYADDGYTPYFTDSVSDWASGTRLTLKHAAGGGVVPFPKAESGVVYKLDDSASLTYYKDTGSTKGNVKFAVRIANYYVPGLAMFEEESQAKAYLSGFDTSKVLEYKKAGDWVTPENPAWSATSSSSAFASVLGRMRGLSLTPVSSPSGEGSWEVL